MFTFISNYKTTATEICLMASKMVPVCVAHRLVLLTLCGFVLFVSLAVQNVESLLEYDR